MYILQDANIFSGFAGAEDVAHAAVTDGVNGEFAEVGEEHLAKSSESCREARGFFALNCWLILLCLEVRQALGFDTPDPC